SRSRGGAEVAARAGAAVEDGNEARGVAEGIGGGAGRRTERGGDGRAAAELEGQGVASGQLSEARGIDVRRRLRGHGAGRGNRGGRAGGARRIQCDRVGAGDVRVVHAALGGLLGLGDDRLRRLDERGERGQAGIRGLQGLLRLTDRVEQRIEIAG
ncbi:hypothetical protein CTJ05_12360, partial [Staphylococcus epidermidis]